MYTGDTKTIHPMPVAVTTAIIPMRPQRHAGASGRIRHTATLAHTARNASTPTSANAMVENHGYAITRGSAAAGHRVSEVRRDGDAHHLARRDRHGPSRCRGVADGGAAGGGHPAQCHGPPPPTSRPAP